MRSTIRGLLLLLSATGLAACASEDPGDEPPDQTGQVTWNQDVAPIVAKHCMSCHQDGGIAPFPLTDFDSAKENAQRMLAQTDANIMPPFDAREDEDCTPRFGWVDDPRLSVADKATLHAWVDGGLARGEDVALPEIPDTALQGVTQTLVPTEGFAASGDRDQFFCFVFDPGNSQLAWLTGLQVNPDVDEVVHHAVITEIGPGAKQNQLVAQHGVGKPFECSDMTTPADFVVNVWTPGNQPMQTSDEIAVPLFPDSILVMQIHYHPAGIAHAPDKTSIDLRLSSVWPRKMYFVLPVGNAPRAPELLPDPDDTGAPQFLIPRNVADHRERMQVAVPPLPGLNNPRLFSANPHMHLVGTHISATIERPAARGSDPKSECLANGGWNFDWQRTYTYDAPLDRLPGIAAGDLIDIECSWDNTITNPFVQRMLNDAGLGAQPVDIALGEQTTNEMCLEIFGLSVDAPPEPQSRAELESLVLPKLDMFGPPMQLRR